MNPFYTPFWQSIFQPIQQRADAQAANSQTRNNAPMNQMGLGNWLAALNPFQTATFRNQRIFRQPQHPLQNFAGPTGRIQGQVMLPAQPQQPEYRGFNQTRTSRMGPPSNVGMGNYIDSFRGKPVGR